MGIHLSQFFSRLILTSSQKTTCLSNLSCNILANFVETDQNFRCGIRVVNITQNKKDRHNMLWSAFLNKFTGIQQISQIQRGCRYIERLSKKSKNDDFSNSAFNKINNLQASESQIQGFSTVSENIQVWGLLVDIIYF